MNKFNKTKSPVLSFQHPMPPLSASDFLNLGFLHAGFDKNKNERTCDATKLRRFRSFFGLSPQSCSSPQRPIPTEQSKWNIRISCEQNRCEIRFERSFDHPETTIRCMWFQVGLDGASWKWSWDHNHRAVCADVHGSAGERDLLTWNGIRVLRTYHACS